MSKGLEMMVASLLKATGIDVEAAKGEALSRIENFEHNVAVLNARLQAIDVNLKAICEFHNIAYTAPVTVVHPAEARKANAA